MNHFEHLIRQTRLYLFLALVIGNLTVLLMYFVGTEALGYSPFVILPVAAVIGGALSFWVADWASKYINEPLRVLWQAILHVSPEQSHAPAPDLEKVRFGRELVTSLSLEVYQLASTAGFSSTSKANSNEMTMANTIMSSLPQPLFVINKDQTIVFANEAAQKYLGLSADDLVGKNMYSVLDFSFPSDDTFDAWLGQSRARTITATKSWEHVRLKLPDPKELLQFDMAAYYNKDNPTGVETLITLFDHSKSYTQDDQAIGFVALAVHELRTPLTMLRGYIEVFEEELDGKLDAELADFMNKMQASAQQLSAFVNNILNVARVEDNQLTLQLTEENWEDLLKSVGDDFNLRAQIHHKTIKYDIAPKLPTVAADRVSVYEVLGNILDNAIKYSGESPDILVKSRLTKDGLVETTITDHGIGIPQSVVPNLFEKFYRNHRTQTQVGGTGLGLYLSKAIIDAHGGNIWVRSKEGEGTTIGFSLQPYVMVAHKLKGSDNKDIVRGAHGWIKNHSLYRR